ncbi:MAG TPA: serine protease [Pyrinomonadaceae bacterium]|nr:serine protease [Pyrinomonadaceae bacterium]
MCAAILICGFDVSTVAQQNRNRSPASPPTRLSATDIARRVLPAVSFIVCDDGESSSQGSGFFIGPGLVITNLHVVKGMRRGSLRTVGGRKLTFHISHVLQIDETSDLALLGIYDAFNVPIPSLQLDARSNLSVGETIYAFGNPEGLTGTMSPGIVSAGLRNTRDRILLQISAPISSGSSGGPVVDSRGRVVGVALGSLKEGQNLNFAVHASTVRLFLNRWYKDNDPKISIWVGLVNAPGQKRIDNEWVWLPE